MSLISQNDIIILDIMLLLSDKTFSESESILNDAKKQLKDYCSLKITPERHKFIKELMLKDLPNH